MIKENTHAHTKTHMTTMILVRTKENLSDYILDSVHNRVGLLISTICCLKFSLETDAQNNDSKVLKNQQQFSYGHEIILNKLIYSYIF